jgi:hypothetical protein
MSASSLDEMLNDDWYWACRAFGELSEPDKFVIACGQKNLWARVRSEIRSDRRCAWMRVNRHEKEPTLEDILDMMLTVVPIYHINQNKFVFEAAKSPVFAKFLHSARSDLCNYVSNPVHSDPIIAEPYSEAAMRHLGEIVSQTLNTDQNWF